MAARSCKKTRVAIFECADARLKIFGAADESVSCAQPLDRDRIACSAGVGACTCVARAQRTHLPLTEVREARAANGCREACVRHSKLLASDAIFLVVV